MKTEGVGVMSVIPVLVDRVTRDTTTVIDRKRKRRQKPFGGPSGKKNEVFHYPP